MVTHALGSRRTRAAVGCILVLYAAAWACGVVAVYALTAGVAELLRWAFG